MTLSKSTCFASRSWINVASPDIWSRSSAVSALRVDISSLVSSSPRWSTSRCTSRSVMTPCSISALFVSVRRSSSSILSWEFRVCAFSDRLDWALSSEFLRATTSAVLAIFSFWSSSMTLSKFIWCTRRSLFCNRSSCSLLWNSLISVAQMVLSMSSFSMIILSLACVVSRWEMKLASTDDRFIISFISSFRHEISSLNPSSSDFRVVIWTLSCSFAAWRSCIVVCKQVIKIIFPSEFSLSNCESFVSLFRACSRLLSWSFSVWSFSDMVDWALNSEFSRISRSTINSSIL